MPEPNQPVDQLAVSRPVPLNSSSSLSVQSPGTPVGIGVGPAELAGGGPAELAGVRSAELAGVGPAELAGVGPAELAGVRSAELAGGGPAELAGVGPAELASSRRSAVMTAAAITRMVAASNHDPRPPVNSLSLWGRWRADAAAGPLRGIRRAIAARRRPSSSRCGVRVSSALARRHSSAAAFASGSSRSP